MKIREENGTFKLNTSQKELEYNLEMLLKANNDKFVRELNIEEIKKISEVCAKKLIDPRYYPISSANTASEFYKIVKVYWFGVCQYEILENYAKN